MQRKLDKKNVYNAGKGKANQELIHLHMSHHYRRILNAKKTVDNSPPHCYKGKRPATSNPVVTKNKLNRSLESPALTDRSISTNSNKGSFSGAESYSGISRYHARCIPGNPAYITPNKQSHINMDLIDRIAYDTKNGPATYRDENWMEETPQQKVKKPSKAETRPSPSAKRRLAHSGSQESAQKRKLIVQKKLKSPGPLIKGSKSFPLVSKKPDPKILKTEAVSKLRSLRVYYPPRKKKSRNEKNSSNQMIGCSLESSNCKCTKICICDTNETVLKKISFNPKEQSLTSSRDSAYNGGVSSLPESRSPTPDERRKKECCCSCCEKNQEEEEEEEEEVKLFKSSKTIINRAESPRTPREASRSPTPKSKPQERQESLKKIQEDALYVKFIHDITTEVLEKSLYTNKALKKVMKKHIANNLCILNKDRMLKEVENLRVQLGIPKDETLLDLEANSDGGSSDVLQLYPVISDSEFLMPMSSGTENVKNSAPETKTSVKVPRCKNVMLSSGAENEKTLSVADSEEDGEVISVIHVTKAIREKRRERSVENTPTMMSRENSSDSDSPFGAKKRSVLKNFKQKIRRSYSSSSSDSGLSRNFATRVREKTEGRVFVTEDARADRREQKRSSLTKKNRNVSFWKYPELNMSQTVEIQHEKTITRERNSSVADEKRDKPKKD